MTTKTAPAWPSQDGGESKILLERVFGVTSSGNAALSCNPATGILAYPAGCVVVLQHPFQNKQSHLHHGSNKSILSLAFAENGQYLVVGETGHNPSVLIWDLETGCVVAEMSGHTHGVAAVAFSPGEKYVVSVGVVHDGSVHVWNWRLGTRVASGKVSSKVNSISFSELGTHFVTAGNRHVKFWYIDGDKAAKPSSVSASGAASGPVASAKPFVLEGKSGVLGSHRNNNFTAIACGRGTSASKTVFAVTESGILCAFGTGRLLEKWVDLKVAKANAISVTDRFIACGCNDGVVRLFDPKNLQYVATVPKPHPLGVDVAAAVDPSQLFARHAGDVYAHVTGVVQDMDGQRVTCLYSDRSLYSWDVRSTQKIGKIISHLFHSGAIWDLQVLPLPRATGDDSGMTSFSGSKKYGGVVTCSADGTLRHWAVDDAETANAHANIYSHELLRVAYAGSTHDSLRNIIPGAPLADQDGKEPAVGIRCARVSADGRYLAAGDTAGNVRLFLLPGLTEVARVEAHDSEVLAVDFSPATAVTGHRYVASSSRDGLIHLFDGTPDPYGKGITLSLVQTFDDHSASVTSVRFASASPDSLSLVSCSADKSVIFRNFDPATGMFVRHQSVAGKSAVYDMEVDCTQKYATTANQDKAIRIYSVKTGKNIRVYRAANHVFPDCPDATAHAATVLTTGGLIRVRVDPSGIYVFASGADKMLRVFDFYSGECLATASGHGEVITAMAVTPDCRHVITASGDGCIFVWALAPSLSDAMLDRMSELRQLPTMGSATGGSVASSVSVGSHPGAPSAPLNAWGSAGVAPGQQQYAVDARSPRIAASGIAESPLDPARQQKDELHALLDAASANPGHVTPSQRKRAADGQSDNSNNSNVHTPIHGSHSPSALDDSGMVEPDPQLYRFSLTPLPSWARKQVLAERGMPSVTPAKKDAAPKPPTGRGKWAQRIDPVIPAASANDALEDADDDTGAESTSAGDDEVIMYPPPDADARAASDALGEPDRFEVTCKPDAHGSSSALGDSANSNLSSAGTGTLPHPPADADAAANDEEESASAAELRASNNQHAQAVVPSRGRTDSSSSFAASTGGPEEFAPPDFLRTHFESLEAAAAAAASGSGVPSDATSDCGGPSRSRSNNNNNNNGSSGTHSSRLSISSRFLSHSQQRGLRDAFLGGGVGVGASAVANDAQQQQQQHGDRKSGDSEGGPTPTSSLPVGTAPATTVVVSRRKDDLSKEVERTRKRLQRLGYSKGSDKDRDDAPEKASTQLSQGADAVAVGDAAKNEGTVPQQQQALHALTVSVPIAGASVPSDIASSVDDVSAVRPRESERDRERERDRDKAQSSPRGPAAAGSAEPPKAQTPAKRVQDIREVDAETVAARTAAAVTSSISDALSLLERTNDQPNQPLLTASVRSALAEAHDRIGAALGLDTGHGSRRLDDALSSPDVRDLLERYSQMLVDAVGRKK